MTIGIDIRVLARGARTGVEEYVINLLSHLLPLDPSIKYKLFYNAFNKAELNYPWINLDNIELFDFRIPNRLFFASARYLNYPKIDKLLGGIDLYFNPHFFVAPVSRKCRKVITFHDLSFKRCPEYFSKRKRLWQLFLMNALKEARQADKIIAVSESTKSDLINLYKINPQKIQVIYSGVGEQFRPMSFVILNEATCDRGSSPCSSRGIIRYAQDDRQIRNKYNLPEKFILYFGTIEPRKNIIGLIKAFEILRNKYNFNINLVIAGANGWLYKNIFKTAKNSEYNKNIIFTDFIDEQDKPCLYNLAQLFIYPSFFEGFGFPPLEAMACGTPVIISNNSSLPEVAGASSLIIEPNNIDEMAWAINQVLVNNKLKNNLIKKGLIQAKKFSWQKCAKQTLDALNYENRN